MNKVGKVLLWLLGGVVLLLLTVAITDEQLDPGLKRLVQRFARDERLGGGPAGATDQGPRINATGDSPSTGGANTRSYTSPGYDYRLVWDNGWWIDLEHPWWVEDDGGFEQVRFTNGIV